MAGLPLGSQFHYFCSMSGKWSGFHALVLVGVGACSLWGATGDTDLSFNPGQNSLVRAAVQDGEAQLVLGGLFTQFGAETRNRLAKVTPEGALVGGFAPDVDGQIYSLHVQDDGAIVFAGTFGQVDGFERNRIARVDANGNLDQTFDPDANNTIYALALQPDGKILLGGLATSVGGVLAGYLYRLDSNGTLDQAFAPGAAGVVFSIAIQPDGKILIGGTVSVTQSVTRTRIVRLNEDGTLDTSFNAGFSSGTVFCIAVQPDGRILVGGNFSLEVGDQTRLNLARLHTDGSLDEDFEADAVGGNVLSIALQTDGKIIAGGNFTEIGGESRTYLARLDPDGTVDPTFNPVLNNSVVGQTIQQNGMLLIGGTFTQVNGTGRTQFARLENDPASGALEATDSTRIEWMRGGSAPEADRVDFEVSVDGGVTFTPLGAGSRIAGGWELTGLDLQGVGLIRGRARVSGGLYSTSSGLVSATEAFDFPVPPSPPSPIAPGVLPAPEVKVDGRKQIRTGRNRIVVRGTATDASNVRYKIRGFRKGRFLNAKGSALQWRIPVRLQLFDSTRVVVVIQAQGPGGISRPVRTRVIRTSN